LSDEERRQGKGFAVIDRRHWSDERAATEDATKRDVEKPAYVAELERALAEKERKLLEFAAAHQSSVDDFDDARVRLRREVAKDVERSRRQLLIEFLDVIDNLDRALDAVEHGGDAATLAEGVALVRDLFVTKLEAFGVTRVVALGQRFDPAMHEALSTVPTDDPSVDGQIVGVIREGYAIGGEVLRPAAVAVAQAPLQPGGLSPSKA
jgi:molecular chaperone GrpE